jgi:hypothetical protein
MASKNSFYCQVCQRKILYNTKEEVISHKDNCGLKQQNEISKETDTGSINIASFTFGGRHSDGLKDMILESASFNQSFKGRKMSEEGLNEEVKCGIGIINIIHLCLLYCN